MDELLEQFLVEGRDLVLEGQADLAALLADPADTRALDGAFRAIHTLKGSVAIFAMAPAERLLHASETILDHARKGADGLPRSIIPRLIASLDQVDRWIDAMERDGALGGDADAIAARLIDADGDSIASPGGSGSADEPVAAPAWLNALIAREADAIAGAEGPLVALRYTPDADAFFRGDDPLALVARVEALVALAILPAGDAWPDAAALDPFSCVLAIEAVSAAPLADLRTLFRLVPDQISFHPIEAIGPAGPAQAGTASFLRVDAARIDALADGVGELSVAANAFSAIGDRAEAVDPDLALAIRAAQAKLERAIAAVHRSVSAVRQVPLGPALARLPRLVREIADELGKPIAFAIRGDQIEVDKQIADGVFEPLLHLVRNALDHGIEPPAARAAAGKPAEGQLSLEVARDGEEIIVTLADDGAGIDPARIRSVAIVRGLIDSAAAEQLSDAAALGLIFTPGFTTASELSDLSGRGVGMDAVQAAVERLRGRIRIDSKVGEGTRMQLRLPVFALTTRLLVVAIGRDHYAVPFDQIAETARVGGDRLVPLGTGSVCVLRDRAVPVLSLAELLGGIDSGLDPARLLVTHAAGERVALRVDGFGERIDAMVRAPSGLLAGVPSVAGTVLLGDGGVLLVLNLPELVG